jgi:hypothetical protein
MPSLPFDFYKIVVGVTSVNFRRPLTLMRPRWKDVHCEALCKVTLSCRHIETCVSITYLLSLAVQPSADYGLLVH